MSRRAPVLAVSLLCACTPPGLTFTKLVDAPPFGTRHFPGCAVFDGKMWISGGAPGGDALADVWSSEDGTKWTRVTDSAGFGRRAGHGMVAFDGKLWVIGGTNSLGGTAMVYRDAWSSEDGKTWTKTADGVFASLRRFVSAAADDRIYAMQGDSEAVNSDEKTKPAQLAVSEDGKKWTTVDAPFTWMEGSAFVGDAGLLVVGGKPETVGNEGVWPGAGVWRYDGNWKQLADKAEFGRRSFHQAVHYSGSFYVLGGDCYYGELEQWAVFGSGSGDSWTKLGSNDSGDRKGGCALDFDGKLFALGGSGGEESGQIWTGE